MAGMYLLCMIVGSSGQGMVLPQENWVPGGHWALDTTEKEDLRIRITAVVNRTVSTVEIGAVVGTQLHKEL
ncbi:hypothetical protein TNCV_1893761 [Trichonephila clavipes]|nr:hypothetical protein TNCV_1893761 [Trichonephila clavipes]